MTKGDKIKLRAELAGKAMAALLISNSTPLFLSAKEAGVSAEQACAALATVYADALMIQLGIIIGRDD